MERNKEQSWRAALLKGKAQEHSGFGRPRHFPKGTTIFSQGDPGQELLILNTGQVELSTVSTAGRKNILAILGRGDVFGELALLDQGTRSATATALSDVTGHSLGYDDFRGFLRDDPEAHFALTLELAAKLRGANTALEDQTQAQGGTRLARALLRLADKFGTAEGDATQIQVQLSQSDLGDLSGLTRANVNRFLRGWADEGVLELDKKTITIFRMDALRDVAEG